MQSSSVQGLMNVCMTVPFNYRAGIGVGRGGGAYCNMNVWVLKFQDIVVLYD